MVEFVRNLVTKFGLHLTSFVVVYILVFVLVQRAVVEIPDFVDGVTPVLESRESDQI